MRRKSILIFAVISLTIIPFFSISAASFSEVSDRLGSSWPGGNSNHTITFRTASAIPPSGRIVIEPQYGAWTALPGLSFADLDLSTSTSRLGPYLGRTLASSSSPAEDGVAVNTNASSTLSDIVITLNSGYGIAAGTYVEVRIGTNALFGATGTRQILNPATTGAHYIVIKSTDPGGQTLDRTDIALAIVDPVSMGTKIEKIRSNGTPSGYLTFGTRQTIMSLNTNYRANCRFSTLPGIPYAAMTETFTFTGQYYHSIMLTGLVNGQTYYRYIRCRDAFNVDDDTDYIINFWISGVEGGTGDETGTPGPGGGGSGGGGGGGMGPDEGPGVGAYLPYPPLPGLPGVVFTGWSYAGVEVNFLQDGASAGKALSNVLGQFGAFIQDLNQGVYTFSLWSQDKAGRKSSTYSTTFWLEEGTQTTVSDVIVSPTLGINKSAVAAGEAVEATGYAVPGKTLEVWLYPAVSGVPDPATIRKSAALAGGDGAWSAILPTAGLLNGTYNIKAKTVIDGVGESDLSLPSALAVGVEAPVQGECSGADLNGDGRVNLTDFSILLFHWGSDNACADQNKDGTVNLTDFSIMMFYWTS